MNAVSILAVCGACSATKLEGRQQQHPMLVTPHHIAEGNTGKEPSAPPAPRVASAPPQKNFGSQPDPEPALSTRQWEYTFRFHGGELSVEKVVHHVLPEPKETARRMGRFAVELWIGHQLLERVRFDFPLLGAPEPPQANRIGEPISLEAGLDATSRVWVPDLSRATRAQLVDRATGDALLLEWPPVTPLSAQDKSKSP